MRPLEVKPGGKEPGTTLSPSGLPEFYAVIFFNLIVIAVAFYTAHLMGKL